MKKHSKKPVKTLQELVDAIAREISDKLTAIKFLQEEVAQLKEALKVNEQFTVRRAQECAGRTVSGVEEKP